MNLHIRKNCDLMLPGIYIIKNRITGKFYIGSTTMMILKRLNHHKCLLDMNKHKNSYLQNSYNKYGKENFLFIAILNCEKKDCLKIEQKFINKFINNNVLFNINHLASGTPSMSKESILKRSQTMKAKYASGEIKSSFTKGFTPWNKGKTYKMPNKKYTKPSKEILYTIKEKHREMLYPEVYIYKENIFIGKFRSSADIEDLSISGYFKQYVKPRNGLKNHKGQVYYYLNSSKITQSCKSNKLYKGLKFSYAALSSN